MISNSYNLNIIFRDNFNTNRFLFEQCLFLVQFDSHRYNWALRLLIDTKLKSRIKYYSWKPLENQLRDWRNNFNNKSQLSGSFQNTREYCSRYNMDSWKYICDQGFRSSYRVIVTSSDPYVYNNSNFSI